MNEERMGREPLLDVTEVMMDVSRGQYDFCNTLETLLQIKSKLQRAEQKLTTMRGEATYACYTERIEQTLRSAKEIIHDVGTLAEALMGNTHS